MHDFIAAGGKVGGVGICGRSNNQWNVTFSVLREHGQSNASHPSPMYMLATQQTAHNSADTGKLCLILFPFHMEWLCGLLLAPHTKHKLLYECVPVLIHYRDNDGSGSRTTARTTGENFGMQRQRQAVPYSILIHADCLYGLLPMPTTTRIDSPRKPKMVVCFQGKLRQRL